jgi:hypothetical protein
MGWVVKFRAILPPCIRDQWYNLTEKLNRLNLNDDKDAPIWKWTGNKKFSVKSVYMHLTKEDSGPDFKNIWKANIREKIKMFMWLVAQKAILTKDNMIKKRYHGDPGCYFVEYLRQLIICFFSALLLRWCGV